MNRSIKVRGLLPLAGLAAALLAGNAAAVYDFDLDALAPLAAAAAIRIALT